MKTWTKVIIGTLAGAAIGVCAAFLGKKHDNDEDFTEIDETETCDSETDEEAE